MSDFRYLADYGRHLLWALPGRCASSSIKYAGASGLAIKHDEAVPLSKLSWWVTIAAIRHPYDRFVSAMWTVLRGRDWCEVIERDPLDRHIAPFSAWFVDIHIDHVIRYQCLRYDWERLRRDYPHLNELPHRHRGLSRPQDWGGIYDWAKIYPLYRLDFERFGYAHYV